MVQNKYDSYSGSSAGSYDNTELKLNPFAEVRGELTRAFGASSEGGQSLGVNMENVQIVDGGIYLHPETEKFKLFPWEEMAGISPFEAADRGRDFDVDDADEFISKTYFGETYTYELLAARVPEVTDEDGNVLIEPQTKHREYGILDGNIEWHDWEYGEDPVEVGNTVSWFDGSDDYGPSNTALSLTRVLTEGGEMNIVDDENINNWHSLPTGENVLRDDLQDRTVNFFIVTREGQNGYNYYDPVVEDAATEERIQPNNRASGNGAAGGDTGNENSPDESDDSSGEVPEEYDAPVADFLSSGKSLNLTEERAANLLDELVADADNALTESMVSDNGGRQHLIGQVV